MRTPDLNPEDDSAAPGIDILHLEDDDEFAALVRLWVAGRGLAIHRVRTRAELMSFLATCAPPPRCLLLDLSLHDSRGLTLCAELKKSPALQQLPIVLHSGAALSSRECLECGACHLIRKGVDGEKELLAALTSVIAQHDRSRGVVDAGDLRLDPQEQTVSLGGRLAAKLDDGPFEALSLLVKSSPESVTDIDLYMAFLERRSHQNKEDPERTVKLVVKNYISRLRGKLGPVAGARIVRSRDEGYVYRPPD